MYMANRPAASLSLAIGPERAEYLYLQVDRDLRDRIARQELRPGDRLPSEVQLAQQFGTTRVTVAKGLAKLEADGLIRRLSGRGTFVAPAQAIVSSVDTSVCDSFEERVRFSGQDVGFRMLAFIRVPAPPQAQIELDLSPEDQLYELERLRLVAGRVVGLELRYIPLELASAITAPMLAEQSTADIMATLLGHHVPTISVTMYPDVADEALASKLAIVPGSPVTIKEHVYRDRDGRALLCGRSTFTSEVRTTYVTGSQLAKRAGHAF